MTTATLSFAATPETVIELEGVFDGVAARRIEAAIAAAGAGDRLRIDLTHVREFHDFGVAILGQAVARSRAIVALSGLGRHPLRTFGRVSVDAAPAVRALSTTWPDAW